MSEIQVFVAHATKVALLALLAGIALRGRARLCWSFAVYVPVVLLGNVLVSFWPSVFFTPAAWVLKQGLYDVLKTAIALELAWRSFQAFPGAARTARRVIPVLLAASTLALALLAPGSSYGSVWDWQTRVATASLWLLTATALMVVWYQVPVHDFQRAIMLGLAPYLLVFVSLLSALRHRGWTGLEPIATLGTIAYLGLVLFWNRAAWRAAPPEPTACLAVRPATGAA